MIPSNSLIENETNLNYLSDRFLGFELEKAISQIDLPDVEVEIEGIKMDIDVQDIHINFQLDSISGHLLFAGSFITIIVILLNLFL